MISLSLSPRASVARTVTAKAPAARPTVRLCALPGPKDDRQHGTSSPKKSDGLLEEGSTGGPGKDSYYKQQRDKLKEGVENASDLKEARKNLYATDADAASVKKADSRPDSVSKSAPANPQPGSPLERGPAGIAHQKEPPKDGIDHRKK